MTENLTNEALKGICNSSFELTHFAILLGQYYISSGRPASLKDILRDVKKHPYPHYIEELKEIDKIEMRSKAKEVTPYE